MNRPRLLRWRHALALRIAPWLKREDGWLPVKDGRGLAHVLSYEEWRQTHRGFARKTEPVDYPDGVLARLSTFTAAPGCDCPACRSARKD